MLARLFLRSLTLFFIILFSTHGFAHDTNKKIAKKHSENTQFVKNEIDKNFPGQLAVDILQKPTPWIAQNKFYLIYELHLTNYQTTPITLTSLKIKGDDNQEFKFSGPTLANMIHVIGMKNPLEDSLTLQSGMSKMIYVWLSFNSLKQVPSLLTHEITFTMQNPIASTTPMVTTDSITVDKTLPLVIRAPLRGSNWVIGNGPGEHSAHRKANMLFQGHDYFSQRYAIDFIQVNKKGFSYHGDKTKNSNYYCYGKDVLAVASGRVVQVRDGIAENIPQSGKMAIPITLDSVGGNHVIIDLGGEKYAFYAHLIPGSIKVKKGDIVQQGQVIAKVGNTGNSSEPHLHFHIVDKPSFLAADSVPYLFDSFYVQPAKILGEKVDDVRVQFTGSKMQKYTDQLALENTVVKFSN